MGSFSFIHMHTEFIKRKVGKDKRKEITVLYRDYLYHNSPITSSKWGQSTPGQEDNIIFYMSCHWSLIGESDVIEFCDQSNYSKKIFIRIIQ